MRQGTRAIWVALLLAGGAFALSWKLASENPFMAVALGVLGAKFLYDGARDVSKTVKGGDDL